MKRVCCTLLLWLAWQAPAWANMDETTDDGQARNTTLITKALSELGISKKNCYCGLAITKQLPFGNKDTVVVIPEIASMEDDGEVFSLHSHILLVDSQTGTIIARYYESAKTNGWDSDAYSLNSITIDTARYQLNTRDRAFGVRVSHGINSRVNPISDTLLSLFVVKGQRLTPVVKRLTVSETQGEWDTQCTGWWITHDSYLSMTNTLHNGYRDILVTTKATKDESRPFKEKQSDSDMHDDCDVLPTLKANSTHKLRFDKQYYQFTRSHNHFSYSGALLKRSTKKHIPMQLDITVYDKDTMTAMAPDALSAEPFDNEQHRVVGTLRYLNSSAKKPLKVIGSTSYYGAFSMVYLKEYDATGNITGDWTLKRFGDGFIGEWLPAGADYDASKSYDIELKLTTAKRSNSSIKAPKADWFGEYYYQFGDNGYQGSFSLKKGKADQQATFTLESATEAPARNQAYIEADVTLDKTGFTLQPFADTPRCEAKVQFFKGFATVAYTNTEASAACGFGHRATAEGLFLKVK